MKPGSQELNATSMLPVTTSCKYINGSLSFFIQCIVCSGSPPDFPIRDVTIHKESFRIE